MLDCQLEQKVLDILNALKEDEDEPYTVDYFHTCHRLKQKERVIVKITLRKRLRAMIKSRTKLNDKRGMSALKIGRIVIVDLVLHW